MIDDDLMMGRFAKGKFEIVLVEGDDEHDGDSGAHAQQLQAELDQVRVVLLVGRVGMSVAGVELGDHVHQGHVDEDARCGDDGYQQYVCGA